MPHAPGGHAPQRAPLRPGRGTAPAAALASSPGGRRAGSAHPASSAAAHARRLPPSRLQVVAAYLLAALGGNAAPAEADIKKILSSGESERVAGSAPKVPLLRGGRPATFGPRPAGHSCGRHGWLAERQWKQRRLQQQAG